MLAGLAVMAVGVTLLLAGPWPRAIEPTVSARQRERAWWRALWWPLVPAIVAVSVLIGWAIMEPAESRSSAAGLGALVRADQVRDAQHMAAHPSLDLITFSTFR